MRDSKKKIRKESQDVYINLLVVVQYSADEEEKCSEKRLHSTTNAKVPIDFYLFIYFLMNEQNFGNIFFSFL